MRAETARKGPSAEGWPPRTDDGRPNKKPARGGRKGGAVKDSKNPEKGLPWNMTMQNIYSTLVSIAIFIMLLRMSWMEARFSELLDAMIEATRSSGDALQILRNILEAVQPFLS